MYMPDPSAHDCAALGSSATVAPPGTALGNAGRPREHEDDDHAACRCGSNEPVAYASWTHGVSTGVDDEGQVWVDINSYYPELDELRVECNDCGAILDYYET